MAEDGVIADYLTAVRRILGPGNQTEECVWEIADHLETAAEGLRSAGVSPAESELRAVQQFGAPDVVAAALLLHRAGSPNLLTRAIGMVAVIGALATAAACVPMAYATAMGGYRPRSTGVALLLIGGGQLCLLLVITALIWRSSHRRIHPLLWAIALPPAALTVLDFGSASIADAVNTPWVTPLVGVVFVAVLVFVLRPWASLEGLGSGWARWCLVAGAGGLTVRSTLQAGCANVCAVDGSLLQPPLANVVLLLAAALLAGGLLWSGLELFAEPDNAAAAGPAPSCGASA